MARLSYYDILGVDASANEKSIKRAFRCRAKLLHPDVNRSARAQHEFQQVNEAYQVLGNATRRRIYDMRLAHGTHTRRVYYRPGAQQPPRWKRRPVHEDQEEPYAPSRFEKLFDKFLFLFMLMAGFAAIIFGIHRAVGEPMEGVNPLTGLIFGLVFTALFIYGWDKKQRMES